MVIPFQIKNQRLQRTNQMNPKVQGKDQGPMKLKKPMELKPMETRKRELRLNKLTNQ